MLLCAKTIKDKTIKMATRITGKQIDDFNSAQAFSIACDGLKKVRKKVPNFTFTFFKAAKMQLNVLLILK